MSHNKERREKAQEMLSKNGYGKMKKIADKEVHKHEKNMHKGKKPTKFASGGHVEGKASKRRLDRKSPHVKVNIIQPAQKEPVPVPVPRAVPVPSASPAHQGMRPSPAPTGAAPPALPPQGMPMAGMRKSGGKVMGGAGGGLGRLQKAVKEANRAKPRNKGGKC